MKHLIWLICFYSCFSKIYDLKFENLILLYHSILSSKVFTVVWLVSWPSKFWLILSKNVIINYFWIILSWSVTKISQCLKTNKLQLPLINYLIRWSLFSKRIQKGKILISFLTSFLIMENWLTSNCNNWTNTKKLFSKKSKRKVNKKRKDPMSIRSFSLKRLSNMLSIPFSEKTRKIEVEGWVNFTIIILTL